MAQNKIFLQTYGNPEFSRCRDLSVSQPISFVSEESFLAVHDVTLESVGEIKFSFRTTETNGVLMYGVGREDAPADLFALMLSDGHLLMVIEIGSGLHLIEIHSSVAANDGELHSVNIRHSTDRGTVTYDNKTHSYRHLGRRQQLELTSTLYVGGFASDAHEHMLRVRLASSMYVTGYVGCLQDLHVNGQQIDLSYLSRLQHRADVIDRCESTSSQCASHPCFHGGRCIQGWNRFLCDCSTTTFTGRVCNEGIYVTILKFRLLIICTVTSCWR